MDSGQDRQSELRALVDSAAATIAVIDADFLAGRLARPDLLRAIDLLGTFQADLRALREDVATFMADRAATLQLTLEVAAGVPLSASSTAMVATVKKVVERLGIKVEQQDANLEMPKSSTAPAITASTEGDAKPDSGADQMPPAVPDIVNQNQVFDLADSHLAGIIFFLLIPAVIIPLMALTWKRGWWGAIVTIVIVCGFYLMFALLSLTCDEREHRPVLVNIPMALVMPTVVSVWLVSSAEEPNATTWGRLIIALVLFWAVYIRMALRKLVDTLKLAEKNKENSG